MIFINVLTSKIVDFIFPYLGHSSFNGKTVEFEEETIFISKSDTFADWEEYDHFKINGLGILITDKKSVTCKRVSVHFLQLEYADKIVETFRRVFHKSFFEKIAEKFIDIFLFGPYDVFNSGGFSIERTIKFLQRSKLL